jgi:hypothetical protein
MALFSMLSVPLLWRPRRHARLTWYALGIMLGAMLYCWYLKWQPWASRLHTPLFAMAAPLLAMTIVSKAGNARKYIGYVVLTCMVFYSLPFTLRNESRPLLSRTWSQQERMQLYFQNRRELFNDYKKAIEVLVEAKAQQVGLYLGADHWEYPFWVFAQRMEKSGRGITFRHVKISNNWRTLEQELPLPLYVIATKKTEIWEYESLYTPVYTSNYVRVLRKSERKLDMDLGP